MMKFIKYYAFAAALLVTSQAFSAINVAQSITSLQQRVSALEQRVASLENASELHS